ncbi:MAG: hypothetical protein FWD06_06085 [Oscillospiraceae bacterium]|nr:hypothetical protein [Oscillospiraceae bacterium]
MKKMLSLVLALVLLASVGFATMISATANETPVAFTLNCPEYNVFVDVPAGVLPVGTVLEVDMLEISREPDELHLPFGGFWIDFFYQGERVQPNGKLMYRLPHRVHNPLDIPPEFFVWTSDIEAYGPPNVRIEGDFVVFESDRAGFFTTMSTAPGEYSACYGLQNCGMCAYCADDTETGIDTSTPFTLSCPFYNVFVDVPAGVLPVGTVLEVDMLEISREPDEQHLPFGGWWIDFYYQGEQVQPNGKLTYRLPHRVHNPLDIPPEFFVWTSDTEAYGPPNVRVEGAFVVFESDRAGFFTTMTRSPSCAVIIPPATCPWLNLLGISGIVLLSLVSGFLIFGFLRILFNV